MTSLMLTTLVEQTNLRLKPDKEFKSVAINDIARLLVKGSI